MNSDHISQNIIEKIKKLLEIKVGRGATEEEAATAMSIAQKLLAKYNLDIRVIKNTPTDRTKQNIKGFALYDYQRFLMSTIAYSTFCTAFIQRTPKFNKAGRTYIVSEWIIIGTEINSISCSELFLYLNDAINRLSNEAYPPPTNLSKSANSFKEGVSYRLRMRIKKQMHEEDKMTTNQTPQSTNVSEKALTVQNIREEEQWLNCDFVYGREPGTTKHNELEKRAKQAVAQGEEQEQKKRSGRTKKSRWDNKDIDAFWAGDEAGKSINLNKQIN